MIALTWTPADHDAALVLGMATAAYLTYHYHLHADGFRRRFASAADPDAVEIASVVRQRVAGGLLLGLAPILTLTLALGQPPATYGLAVPDWGRTLAWVGGLLAVLVPILRQAARKPDHRQRYPQMRLGHWDRRRWWTNTLSWGVYLLGYETFFRGALLFWLIGRMGVWPGILTMNALYALAHLNKDAGETWGSAVMGVLFAIMTLTTGGIWAAVIVHWVIATCSETFAMASQPAEPRAAS